MMGGGGGMQLPPPPAPGGMQLPPPPAAALPPPAPGGMQLPPAPGGFQMPPAPAAAAPPPAVSQAPPPPVVAQAPPPPEPAAPLGAFEMSNPEDAALWVPKYDDGAGCYYFFHPKSKRSTWTNPNPEKDTWMEHQVGFTHYFRSITCSRFCQS
jgi:hypothetical protein